MCAESNIFGNGRGRFICFMRWMSWPIFFSAEDDNEKNSFWRDVLIPAVEDTIKTFSWARPETNDINADSYPWPLETTVKIKRADFGMFLELLNARASHSEAWSQTLTMTLKLGQKSSALPSEDFFKGTLGQTMKNFDIQGIHSMFWSTGCMFDYPPAEQDSPRELKVGFWSADFLEKTTATYYRRSRSRKLYHLMGTTDLAAVQSKGHPPECMLKAWKTIKEESFDQAVQFDMESCQFYSTFVYLFKSESISCNPMSPDWRQSSPVLTWFLKFMGADKSAEKQQKDLPSPLQRFISALETLPCKSDLPLRVEPTFYLKFGNNQNADSRIKALKSMFNQSALIVGNCFLHEILPDRESHVTCDLHTSLDRLRSLALIYNAASSRIRTLAKVSRVYPSFIYGYD